MYAICQALCIIKQRQENSHCYTVFVGSTEAIERIRSDSIGPGQRFTLVAIEVCTRLMPRANEVTVCWVPAHHGAPGNEKVGEFAKAVAEGGELDSAVSDEYRWGTSLSHMTGAAIEARSRSTAQWIKDHVRPQPKCGPPPGKGLRRKLLRAKVGCRPILPAHVRTCRHRPLPDKADDDRCWWCGGGKKQNRYHLFIECRAQRPQISKLWKGLGKAHGWKHPRAPSAR